MFFPPPVLWLILLAVTLAFSVMPLTMLIGSLAGANLAPAPDLATLPIAMTVVGMAFGVTPTAIVSRYLGRSRGIGCMMLITAVACWLAAVSIEIRSFALYCLCHGVIGLTLVSVQQLRFAAIEAVPPAKASAAVSFFLCNGIISAVIGPEMAIWGAALSPIEYQGGYWLAALFLILAGLVIFLTPLSPVVQTVKQSSGRSLREIAKTPGFIMAVGSSASGFAIMTFVMTATPLSMHHAYGHSLADTKWVLQCHIAAMFTPSLISHLIVRWFGLRRMMMIGLLAYAVTLATALASSTLTAFWIALVSLGVGWNFLFVAGTTQLTKVYRKGENLKTQTLHDTISFTCQAVGSLAAGWIMAISGWSGVMWVALIPMLLMAGILLWTHNKPDAGKPALHTEA